MRLMTAANIWGLHCQLVTVLALAAVIKHVDGAAQAGADRFPQNPIGICSRMVGFGVGLLPTT